MPKADCFRSASGMMIIVILFALSKRLDAWSMIYKAFRLLLSLLPSVQAHAYGSCKRLFLNNAIP